MKLVDLIRTICPDAVQKNAINPTLEMEEVKVKLMFSDAQHPKLNIVLPIAHPVLIAWYDYEVEFLAFPQKNIVEVTFANFYCE